jgi:hypothetical protein
LVVAFSGFEAGEPGAAGGYPRANGGVGLIVPPPYPHQGGISTNIGFFGQTNIDVGVVLSQRFTMVEGVPVDLVAQLDVSIGTTGELGGDNGITADFTARPFLRPVDATVTMTSASGYAYAVPSPTPANIGLRREAHQLTLSWPNDQRGWRLVVNTNLAGGLLNTNGCTDCLRANWFTVPAAFQTNEIAIPFAPGLRSAYYRFVWP